MLTGLLGKEGLVFACVVLFLFLSIGCVFAGDNPPPITWDWFKAAEIYKKDPKRGAEDLKIAAHYYRLSAAKGNRSAAYKLGEMYEAGLGVRKDAAAALSWYRAAAEAGDKYAQFKLGLFYQKGLGVAADPTEAVYWYGIASRQDNAWADHMLGFMFADGNGVPRDEAAARRYFERSLPRTGDAWAQWRLALLTEKTDPARARKLFRQSAAAGNPDAKKALAARGW